MNGKERRAQKQRNREKARAGRLEAFESACAELRAGGLEERDRTYSVSAAGRSALLAVLPLWAAAIVLFVFVSSVKSPSLLGVVWFFLAAFAGIPLHEFLHAAVWAAANGTFSCVRLGMEGLTPYCACSRPMRRAKYLAGCLAPFFVLGVGLTAAGVASGMIWLFAAGLFHVFAAGGDLTVALRALCAGRGAILLDHPVLCGFYAYVPRKNGR